MNVDVHSCFLFSLPLSLCLTLSVSLSLTYTHSHTQWPFWISVQWLFLEYYQKFLRSDSLFILSVDSHGDLFLCVFLMWDGKLKAEHCGAQVEAAERICVCFFQALWGHWQWEPYYVNFSACSFLDDARSASVNVKRVREEASGYTLSGDLRAQVKTEKLPPPIHWGWSPSAVPASVPHSSGSFCSRLWPCPCAAITARDAGLSRSANTPGTTMRSDN